jgi:low temperature requirement protein LtrA
MNQTFNEEHDTYNYLAAFYLSARVFTALYCALIAFLLPLVKGMMIAQGVNILIAAAIWIASTQVEGNGRYACIFVALAIDLFGSMIIVALFRYGKQHATKIGKRLEHFFEFYPAINIEHKVERTNAFICLVLGYSVVGIMFQNQGFPMNAFLGKAILGLCQAFIFNWLYFDVDGANIHVHAIRRHVVSGKQRNPI